MATQNAIGSGKPLSIPFGGTGLATITDHSVMVGSSTGAVTPLTVGTNGQVLLGSTGADPVFATLASSGGTVTFTAGAGTLNLEAVSTGGTTLKNETGTTYTLILTDASKYLTLTNAASIAVTIPTNAVTAFDIGTIIAFSQGGAGQVTFSGAGTTLQSADSALTTVKIYSVGVLVKIATDTWQFGGDLEA